ncbi:MAG: HNH endonuclease [Promethearchaeota archaeon]
MSISSKTRKLLWGRSGNRCAICRKELISNHTAKDDESVVGDECHIISKESNGPRHDPNFPKDKIDNYGNLILLCKVHHKIVDDQENTFTPDKLYEIKKKHVEWVNRNLNSSLKANKLAIKRIKDNIPQFLAKFNTGRELLNILIGACAFDFDHDELKTEEEVNIISSFLQNTQEIGDFGLELDSSDKVKISYDLSKDIQELDNYGFWIFGGREIRKLESDKEASDWPIAIIRIFRKTNSEIIKVNAQSIKKK